MQGRSFDCERHQLLPRQQLQRGLAHDPRCAVTFSSHAPGDGTAAFVPPQSSSRYDPICRAPPVEATTMQRSEVVPTSSYSYRKGKRSFSSPGRSFLCEPPFNITRVDSLAATTTRSQTAAAISSSPQRTFDHVGVSRDDSADSMFNADCVSGFLVSETHHGPIHLRAGRAGSSCSTSYVEETAVVKIGGSSGRPLRCGGDDVDSKCGIKSAARMARSASSPTLFAFVNTTTSGGHEDLPLAACAYGRGHPVVAPTSVPSIDDESTSTGTNPPHYSTQHSTTTASTGAGGEGNRVSSLEYSYLRTELANERTFLAWIRTACGLVTLGFAIDKLSPAKAHSSSRRRTGSRRGNSSSSHFPVLALAAAKRRSETSGPRRIKAALLHDWQHEQEQQVEEHLADPAHATSRVTHTAAPPRSSRRPPDPGSEPDYAYARTIIDRGAAELPPQLLQQQEEELQRPLPPPRSIIHFDISPETVDSISGILFVLLGVVAAVYGTVRYYAIRSGLAHQNNNRVRRMGYRRIGIRWFVSGLGLCAALAMSLVFLRRFCGDPD